MINLPNSIWPSLSLGRLLSILCLSLHLVAFAGDPIPGIDITVDQRPNGIVKKGTTNASGEVIFSGLQPGPCVVTLLRNGRTQVIGKQVSDRIILPGKGKTADVKPIRLELSAKAPAGEPSGRPTVAQQGDTIDRKRPGGTLQRGIRDGALDGADATASQRANHNTTRSNRLAPKALDTDDDGDGIPTTTRAQDYNSSRSNTTAARHLDDKGDTLGGDGMDDDCDSIVEILPMPNGRIKVTVTCAE